jgi:hypothetical protein
MRRISPLLIVCAIALAACGASRGSTSSAQLWTAFGGQMACGVAIHPVNSPPMQILCSSPLIPPPLTRGFGDPGFVFLGSTGKPQLTRTSQDTYAGTHAVALKTGTSWSVGPISVTCTISATAMRCTNRSHHGFTITKTAYHAF